MKLVSASAIALICLASCTGGSTSNAPPAAAPLAPQAAARTGTVSVSAELRTSQANRRTPKFIGAGVVDVAYQFYSSAGATAGEPSGSEAVSCNNSNGAGTNCSIVIPSIPQGTYGGLLLSLVNSTPATIGLGFAVQTSDAANATTGTDSYTPTTESGGTLVSTLTGNAAKYGFSVAAAGTTTLADVFAPVNHTPAISFAQSYEASPATVFFVDGTGAVQSVTLAVNETDPSGNVITTANGPVADYPTLTPSAPDAYAFSPAAVSVAPASSAGTTIAVQYKGTTTPATPSETVNVSDGTAATTATIPFVSLAVAASGTGGFAGSDVYVNASQNVKLTVTEANAYDVGSGGTPSADALTSTTTCASGAFTVADDEGTPQSVGAGTTTTPFDGTTGNASGTGGGSAPTSGSPNGEVTYTVTGATPAGACTLTIASSLHAALALTFTIAPNTGNLTIGSSSTVRKR